MRTADLVIVRDACPGDAPSYAGAHAFCRVLGYERPESSFPFVKALD